MKQDELRELSSLKKQEAKRLVIEKLKFAGITKQFNFKNFTQILPRNHQYLYFQLLIEDIDGRITLQYTCSFSEYLGVGKHLFVECNLTYPSYMQGSCVLYKFTLNEILKEL